MARIVAGVENFLFRTRIRETAALYGIETEFVSTLEQLREHGRGASLVIVDLNLPGSTGLKMAAEASAFRVPVVCYLNHVQTELAREARKLGIEAVWPQSLFVKQLPVLLSELSSA